MDRKTDIGRGREGTTCIRCRLIDTNCLDSTLHSTPLHSPLCLPLVKWLSPLILSFNHQKPYPLLPLLTYTPAIPISSCLISYPPQALASSADLLYELPLDIGVCARAIRHARLDVLIYPEIGIDPVSYYLSFSRLAPVQAAWYGHPDTTGVSHHMVVHSI